MHHHHNIAITTNAQIPQLGECVLPICSGDGPSRQQKAILLIDLPLLPLLPVVPLVIVAAIVVAGVAVVVAIFSFSYGSISQVCYFN